MATLQEPEIQFAQRLASNEKPIRSKAIKKLRKYIIVRSQKSKGGFTSEELLKLWKGLFYCLWMQDKPLLQEELSNQISGLFHCFQSADGQFLYLGAFLQTVKREWTGIDRLRMDKFYQLVRFVFRQTFEMLKKREWDASLVNRFLDMLTSQVLQGTGTAPSGLQFHILDLYLAELARVGSAELSADQNLTLVTPFCKIVAKTKDHILFKAICNSIFSTIIDQAPFAIEDLLREIKAAEDSDSDSGQASQDDEDEEEEEEMKGAPVGKKSKRKAKGKLLNGTKSKVAEEDDEDDDQSLEDEDTELPDDDGSEPVLQFDYAALADKLFEFASRGNAPSHNRQRLYKIIKILRDLSEGVFPQDDYPEEVSTDEDDEMFGSRERLKRKGRRHAEEGGEAEAPAAKKKKKKGNKTEKSNDGEANQDAVKDDEPAKKIKKKKKKAAKEGGEGETAEVTAPPAEMETQAITEDQSEPSPATVTEAAGQSEPQAAEDGDGEPLKTPSRRKRGKGKKSITAAEPTSQTGEQPAAAAATTQEEDASTPAVEPAASTNQKGKKKNESPVVEVVANEAEATPAPPEETAADSTADSTKTTTPRKRARRRSRKSLTPHDAAEEAEAPTESAQTPIPDAAPETTTTETAAPAKKKKPKGSQAAAGVKGQAETESAAVCDPKPPAEDTTAPKKTTKKIANKQEAESPADDVIVAVKKNKKASKTEAAAEPMDAVLNPDQTPSAVAAATPASKRKQKKATTAEEARDGVAAEETPAAPSSQKKGLKKKRKIPVVFEFEADEVEAAAKLNGLASEETPVTSPKKAKLQNGAVAAKPSTKSPGKKLLNPKKKPLTPGKELISFQKKVSVPTPLFFKTKGTPGTPGSKKPQTPKSEAKKVTFGLKNNKTAEFRKSDRSLLLSPEGSSRVPFDPTQKPKFGVLKSPASPMVFRKTTKPGKKTPNGGAKPRPTAADFF